MSIEKPGLRSAERPKTEAEEKVENLTKLKQELALVQESLRMETRSDTAGFVERSKASAEAALVSDALIETGDTDMARVALDTARRNESASNEWVEVQTASPTIEVGGLPTGELAQKLERLGVDMKNASYDSALGLIQAVAVRESEIDALLREARLDTPNGREEMVIEVITKSDALSESKLANVTKTLENLTKTPSFQPSVSEILESLHLESMEVRWYPKQVQKSVAWRMIQSALLNVSEKRRAETAEKLSQLRAELEEKIEQGA